MPVGCRIPAFLMTVSLLAVACTTAALPPPGVPRAEAPKQLPAGSSWAFAERNTGSFGSETRQVTVSALGERTWEERPAVAFSDGGNTVYFDRQGHLLAVVRDCDGSLIVSFEPYLAMFDWPLFVGKWWPNRFRQRDHVRGRTFDHVVWDGEVVAYEPVKTPAGTFHAFKIVLQNRFARTSIWWSPEMGIPVKSVMERWGTPLVSPGRRERDLVSYDMKK